MKIATCFTLTLALTTFAATSLYANETISNQKALELFSNNCLQNAGDKDAMFSAIELLEGMKIHGTASSGQITATHESKSFAFLIVGTEKSLQCILKYDPDGPVVEATTAAISALASAVDVPENAIQNLGNTLVLEAPVGTVMIRMGSDIVFMLKNNK